MNKAIDKLEQQIPDEAYMPEPRPYTLTDTGNAQRFIDIHGSNLHYVHELGHWIKWDERCWRTDTAKAVMLSTADVSSQIKAEAFAINTENDENLQARQENMLKWAHSSLSKNHRQSMLSLATSEPGTTITTAELDTDPWLLTLSNGTYDLQADALRDHRRNDLITVALDVEYRPDAECPAWNEFLCQIFNDDHELIGFIQRAVGYSLTGDISEQCLFVSHGTGANGKSTFIEAITKLLGKYACAADMETFMRRETRGGGANEDIARLRGARFVAASETAKGQCFNESRIKSLTGGDTIVARFSYGHLFEFHPTFKIWLACNRKPSIGTGHAIWRRLYLIPFMVTIPKAEQVSQAKLLETFRAERAGILAWAIEGCRQWQVHGLRPPEIVAKHTAEYQKEMDIVGEFITARCNHDETLSIHTSELYGAYKEWAMQCGQEPWNNRDFLSELRDKGYVISMSAGRNKVRKLGLKAVS